MTTASTTSTSANRQIMLSLSYLAYCGDRIKRLNRDEEIGDLILAGMKQISVLCTNSSGTLVPNWSQVWGPVSYTTPGSLYQDNLMYLVQNQHKKSQYVIAIRGTNHISDLDWLMDDLDVLQQMPWPPNSTTATATGMISESTSIALQVLLTMKFEGRSLLEYLATVTASPLDLWVTGHSLGGCLASAFGLYLTEGAGRWDKSNTSTVSCVTFAAPTAGNAAFAALVDKAFSSTVFDRVQCSFDIVPLAWDASNLVTIASDSWDNNTSNIFDIYDQGESETGIDFSEMETPEDDVWDDEVLDSVLPSLQSAIFTSLGYTQPSADAVPLLGNFNGDFCAYGDDFETTAMAFGKQAAYQHSCSYPILLGVDELNSSLVINETGSEVDADDLIARGARPRARLLRTLIVAAFNSLKEARSRTEQAGSNQRTPSGE